MLARLLVADGVMELPLHLKSLKKFLQLWNEVDECSDDEDSNQELTRPVSWSDITIADCTESDKHKPASVEQGDSGRLFVVNALNVVKEAHPGSGRKGGERERGRRNGGEESGETVWGERGGRGEREGSGSKGREDKVGHVGGKVHVAHRLDILTPYHVKMKAIRNSIRLMAL